MNKYEIRMALEESDVDRALVAVWFDARSAADRAEDEMRDAIKSIRYRLDRTEQYLVAGYRVNSLGELQGSALDLDRNCALREAAYDRLRTVEFYLAERYVFAGLALLAPPEDGFDASCAANGELLTVSIDGEDGVVR